MSEELIKRGRELDSMRSLGIAEKLTLDEADSIVCTWGIYLEHAWGLNFLFGNNIPKSLLPYPIEILQGALNKMQGYYFKQGKLEKVKLLEETEIGLMQYADDEYAIDQASLHFGIKKWKDAFLPGLKEQQKKQAEAGYLVDQSLFKLNSERMNELLTNHSKH